MDFIIEFIVELIFEGVIEAGTNKKVPKFIRYPLIFLIILFYIFFIGCFILMGIDAFKKSVISGLIIFIITAFITLLTIIAFRKKYKEMKKNN